MTSMPDILDRVQGKVKQIQRLCNKIFSASLKSKPYTRNGLLSSYGVKPFLARISIIFITFDLYSHNESLTVNKILSPDFLLIKTQLNTF